MIVISSRTDSNNNGNSSRAITGASWPVELAPAEQLFNAIRALLRVKTSVIPKHKFVQMRQWLEAEYTINQLLPASDDGEPGSCMVEASGTRMKLAINSVRRCSENNVSSEVLKCVEMLLDMEPKASVHLLLLDSPGGVLSDVLGIVIHQGLRCIQNGSLVHLWNVCMRLVRHATEFGCPLAPVSARDLLNSRPRRKGAQSNGATRDAENEKESGTCLSLSGSDRATSLGPREKHADSKSSPVSPISLRRSNSAGNVEVQTRAVAKGPSPEVTPRQPLVQRRLNVRRSSVSLPLITPESNSCTLSGPEPKTTAVQKLSPAISKSSDRGDSPGRSDLPAPRLNPTEAANTCDSVSEMEPVVKRRQKFSKLRTASLPDLARGSSSTLRHSIVAAAETDAEWELNCCRILWESLPPQSITYAIGVALHAGCEKTCSTKIIQTAWSLLDKAHAVESMIGNIGISRLRLQMDMFVDLFARSLYLETTNEEGDRNLFTKEIQMTMIRLKSLCVGDSQFAQVCALYGVPYIVEYMSLWSMKDGFDGAEKIAQAGHDLLETLRPHLTRLFHKSIV